MNELKSIAVFCGSNAGNNDAIINDAKNLGKYLAENDIKLIYGGSKIGIMGAVANEVLENGGKVIGVIPEFLKLEEVVHLGLTELITTENMHQRKLKMHDLSEGFIALPGGFGTLEELFEIITWAQLGIHSKPIGLLNSNGFYDDLIKMLENMVDKKFLKQSNFDILLVDNKAESLVKKMKSYTADTSLKWLGLDKT